MTKGAVALRKSVTAPNHEQYLERFAEDTRHMIIFGVLEHECLAYNDHF